jgi:hypothetical protein
MLCYVKSSCTMIKRDEIRVEVMKWDETAHACMQALFIIIISHGIIHHTFEFLLEPVVAATGNLFQSSIRSANRHQNQ